MRPRRTALVLVATLAASSWGGRAGAQAISSPRGSVSQLVDGTTVTVEYYRPSVRGRAIFGRLVRWGELWTPGANWATTVEVDRDVRFQGQPLPKGKYSLWAIPQPDTWTLVLSRQARRFHVQRPNDAEEQLRVTVRPDSGPHAEMLTFAFPVVTRTGATLAFQWAGTVVPIALEVAPSRAPVVAARPHSAYVGTYELRPGDGGAGAPPIRFEVTDRGGRLWVRTASGAVEPGLDTEFDLEPIGGDEFHPRQYRNGVLIGVEADEIVAFRMDDARASGIELRGVAEQKVLARGSRVRP